MKEWALKYAEIGLAVFPLKNNSKFPATSNGFKAATTDSKQIAAWWDKYPDRNIGIATGSISDGVFVIDLDTHEEDKNGIETFREWQQEHGELPETCQVITGGGGIHLLYRDGSMVKCRKGLYPGIDIKGDGGYIVAPPSIHPDGGRYEWEVEHHIEDMAITQADGKVLRFLNPIPEVEDRQAFQQPGTIPEGSRTDIMVRLVGSLKAKGLDDEAIKAAVRAENGKKCIPPLSEEELHKTVFPALKRGWETTSPYSAVCDRGEFRKQKSHSLDMVAMDSAREKSPDWLITDYMPRYQITSLAGDGGSGKTTVWCALAAAVSSGRRPFILDGLVPFDFAKYEPENVMFFSAEDSFEYTLKRRLRKNGANLKNIYSIDIADERFQDIKFNSPFLEQLLAKYRPALCVFDPIQAFVPPDIRMGDRNAMRSCLAPLIGYGEKYGTTFLIVEHANKQSGVWGRKRIADSADIWDISRSVIMAGETSESGIRYLSHEKSNYSVTGETILYTLDDEIAQFKGYTTKKDKDFVTEVDYTTKQMPQREEAKEFIHDFLKDGEKEVSELDEMAKAMSMTKSTMTRAKSEMKRDGKLKYRSSGYGADKKFYVSLIATENMSE